MANSGYKVNEDGSVTKINSSSGDSENNRNSGGSSGNGGCIVFIIVFVITIILYAVSNSGTDSSNEVYEDSLLVEEIAIVDTAMPAPVDTAPATPSSTYLRVSDDNIVMDAFGGNKEITVYTDGEWYIDVDVAEWGHLTKNAESVVLHLDKNTSLSTRTDYFTLRSGSYTKTVNITQYGNTNPSAEIKSIWIDHSVYQNGQKGMKIHVKFTVDNMKGKTIYANAYFYWGDNTTPLQDAYGNNLCFSGSATPGYDCTRYDNYTIFVPYAGLNMRSGQGDVELSFDIAIEDAFEGQLARWNNTQITFYN